MNHPLTANRPRHTLKTADDYRRQADRYSRYAQEALAKHQRTSEDYADTFSREAAHYTSQARHYATLADLAGRETPQPTLTETADQPSLF